MLKSIGLDTVKVCIVNYINFFLKNYVNEYNLPEFLPFLHKYTTKWNEITETFVEARVTLRQLRKYVSR